MAKADNVHSTPPPQSTTDPIYAAIERHKNAARVWEAAVNVWAAFPDSANPRTNEQRQQLNVLNDAVTAARLPLIDAGLDLIETAPTTLAGIVAALEYIRDQLQFGGGALMPADIALDTVDGARVGARRFRRYPRRCLERYPRETSGRRIMTIGCLTIVFVAVVLAGAVCFVLAIQMNRSLK